MEDTSDERNPIVYPGVFIENHDSSTGESSISLVCEVSNKRESRTFPGLLEIASSEQYQPFEQILADEREQFWHKICINKGTGRGLYSSILQLKEKMSQDEEELLQKKRHKALMKELLENTLHIREAESERRRIEWINSIPLERGGRVGTSLALPFSMLVETPEWEEFVKEVEQYEKDNE